MFEELILVPNKRRHARVSIESTKEAHERRELERAGLLLIRWKNPSN
jgi:hypothetical protein